jgi:hypothetical protein
VLQKSWIDVREVTDALALVTCLAWLCELSNLLESGKHMPQDIFIIVGTLFLYGVLINHDLKLGKDVVVVMYDCINTGII